MKYFYDTEFLETGSSIHLISIGIVAEDGREYYGVVADAPWDRIAKHKWLCENVVPHLPLRGNKKVPQSVARPGKWLFEIDLHDVKVKPQWVIANEIREFLMHSNDDIELWAYYGAYDHVALMWMYGPMIRRPERMPMFSHDIMQYAKALYCSDSLPTQDGTTHNALEDARWNKKAWQYLDEQERKMKASQYKLEIRNES